MSGQNTFLRTAGLGALVAALVGCAAGSYLRPELEGPRPGQTLVVTPTPEVEYASFAGYTTPNHEHAYSIY